MRDTDGMSVMLNQIMPELHLRAYQFAAICIDLTEITSGTANLHKDDVVCDLATEASKGEPSASKENIQRQSLRYKSERLRHRHFHSD